MEIEREERTCSAMTDHFCGPCCAVHRSYDMRVRQSTVLTTTSLQPTGRAEALPESLQ